MDRQKIEENTVLISKKPLANYILASNRILRDSSNITMKARGMNINKLVNLAEILKRDGLKEKSIKIGTTTFKSEEGNDIFVSEMIIELEK